ncbi:MAG: hypothetical protein V7K55_24045 [Nostoc sp.]|uniref:hypothetical protein n=1 Tax=Nostoc sp. TaxID=1180 RepID=UPI002FFB5DE9
MMERFFAKILYVVVKFRIFFLALLSTVIFISANLLSVNTTYAQDVPSKPYNLYSIPSDKCLLTSNTSLGDCIDNFGVTIPSAAWVFTQITRKDISIGFDPDEGTSDETAFYAISDPNRQICLQANNNFTVSMGGCLDNVAGSKREDLEHQAWFLREKVDVKENRLRVYKNVALGKGKCLDLNNANQATMSDCHIISNTDNEAWYVRPVNPINSVIP